MVKDGKLTIITLSHFLVVLDDGIVTTNCIILAKMTQLLWSIHLLYSLIPRSSGDHKQYYSPVLVTRGYEIKVHYVRVQTT